MRALDHALAATQGVMDALQGDIISYRRREITIPLWAVVGESRFDSESTDGLTTQVRTRDWLIRADHLVLAGERVEPAAGDEIMAIELDGSRTVWEVSAPGGMELAWRYSDPARTRLRVHTREIGDRG